MVGLSPDTVLWVRTFKYMVHTFLRPRNPGIVSEHIPLSPNCVHSQFTYFLLMRNSGIVSGHNSHFGWLEIVGLCPDTALQVRTVQIYNSHIFAGWKFWDLLLDCVQTLSSESTLCKYLVYPGPVWQPEKRPGLDCTGLVATGPVVQSFRILNWKTDMQLVFLTGCRLVSTSFAWLSDFPLNYLQTDPRIIKFGWNLSEICSKHSWHIFSKHITVILIVSHSILVQFAWFLAHFWSYSIRHWCIYNNNQLQP